MIAVLVGATAALIGSVQFVPQVVHTIRQRHDPQALAGVSVPTFVMLAVSTTLWLAYGVFKRDPIIMAPNVLTVCGAGVILIIVGRARRRVTQTAPVDPDVRP